MVLKKADENSIIMKSVSVPELLSCRWHWAMCFSYTDPRFSHMFKLTQLVSVQQGFHPTQSGPRIDSLPCLALLSLPVQCRCVRPANHAGLFEGQPLHMLTKRRTLYLEWYSWESGRYMKNRARKMSVPTRSSWNLLGSRLRVWLWKLRVLLSALPYASSVTLD